MSTWYRALHPVVFRLHPEVAHVAVMQLLRLAAAVPPVRGLLRRAFRPAHGSRPVQAFGLTFPNRVGLAAGYDKDALGWRGLAILGFGHIEIGTVTPRPQPGNDRPRIFRLVEDEGVINRMGFPGRGAAFAARQLRGRRLAGQAPHAPALILGVNIGKNRDTPLDRAVDDYVATVRAFAPLADYLAVNVSSPNTPGLRSLQSGKALHEILAHLAAERDAQIAGRGCPLPILVKLAPDLAPQELDAALDAIIATGMEGVIISNTTLARDGLRSPLASESGGLSGTPLRRRNTDLVRRVARMAGSRLPIIASGGIMSVPDAQEKLDAGATLIQIYTGMIYAGPTLAKEIVEGLA